MKIYVEFMNGDKENFEQTYREYEQLLQQGDPAFNHQYDKLVEIARLTFDGAYQKAIDKLKEGSVNVDSSQVAVCIYHLAGDTDNRYEAVRRRFGETDSLFSIVRNANFDQLSTELTLMKSREEASENRKTVKRLTNWIMVIIVVFLIIYIMGRRRLMRIIWDKNKKLKSALVLAEESSRMRRPSSTT